MSDAPPVRRASDYIGIPAPPGSTCPAGPGRLARGHHLRATQKNRMPPSEMVRVFRSPGKISAPVPFSRLYSATSVMYLFRL